MLWVGEGNDLKGFLEFFFLVIWKILVCCYLDFGIKIIVLVWFVIIICDFVFFWGEYGGEVMLK